MEKVKQLSKWTLGWVILIAGGTLVTGMLTNLPEGNVIGDFAYKIFPYFGWTFAGMVSLGVTITLGILIRNLTKKVWRK